MKAVTILEAFDGYPDGQTRRRFVVGETPSLDDDYADLLISKGLAADSTKAAPMKATKPEKQS